MTRQRQMLVLAYSRQPYGRTGIDWSKITLLASLLMRSLQPLLCPPWMMDSGVNLFTCGHLQRTRYFLLVCFQICTYDVYQHLHLLQGVSDQNKQNHARVKCPVAIGSRCYFAHMHSYVSVNTLVMQSLDSSASLNEYTHAPQMSLEVSPIISYSWFCCLSDHHFCASIRTRTRRTL